MNQITEPTVRPLVELQCPSWCTDEHGVDADGVVHRTDIAKLPWGRVEVNVDILLDGAQFLIHPPRIIVDEDGNGRGNLDAAEARELAKAICKAAELADSIHAEVSA